MPAFFIWLFEILETRIGSIVISALLSLGLSWTTYTFSVAPLKSLIVSSMAGAPALAVNVLGFLWVDRAVTLLLSAAAAKAAVQAGRQVLTRNKGTS